MPGMLLWFIRPSLPLIESLHAPPPLIRTQRLWHLRYLWHFRWLVRMISCCHFWDYYLLMFITNLSWKHNLGFWHFLSIWLSVTFCKSARLSVRLKSFHIFDFFFDNFNQTPCVHITGNKTLWGRGGVTLLFFLNCLLRSFGWSCLPLKLWFSLIHENWYPLIYMKPQYPVRFTWSCGICIYSHWI